MLKCNIIINFFICKVPVSLQNAFKMLKFLQKINRCFYCLAKDAFSINKQSKISYLDLIVLIYTFHLFLIIYLMYNNFDTFYDFQKYDLLAYYAYINIDHYDLFMPITVVLFVYFRLITNYLLLFVDSKSEIWVFWYQLIVASQDNYYFCQKSQREINNIYKKKVLKIRSKLNNVKYLPACVSEFLGKIYSHLHVKVEMFTNMDNINKSKFFSFKMASLPNISNELQTQVVLSLIIFDKLILIGVIFISMFFLTFYLYHMFTLPMGTHSMFAQMFFHFEYLLGFYEICNVLQLTVFFVSCSWYGSTVFTGHLNALYSKVKQLIKTNKRNCFISLKHLNDVNQLMAEHNKVCYLVLCGSQKLFSNILLIFVLTNVPNNVYIIWRIIFQRQSFVDFLVFWTIVLIQMIAAVLVFGPVAYQCKIFHQPAKFLSILQNNLSGHQWLMTKLKLDDFNHRIIQGPKISVSIGFLKAVTYKTSLEVSYS